MPSDVAAVQLLKAAALDVIRDSGLANPLSMAWEPGVVYVKDEITSFARKAPSFPRRGGPGGPRAGRMSKRKLFQHLG